MDDYRSAPHIDCFSSCQREMDFDFRLKLTPSISQFSSRAGGTWRISQVIIIIQINNIVFREHLFFARCNRFLKSMHMTSLAGTLPTKSDGVFNVSHCWILRLDNYCNTKVHLSKFTVIYTVSRKHLCKELLIFFSMSEASLMGMIFCHFLPFSAIFSIEKGVKTCLNSQRQ